MPGETEVCQMHVEIRRTHAYQSCEILTIPFEELDGVRLSMPCVDALRRQYGIVRFDLPDWWEQEVGKRAHSLDPAGPPADPAAEGHVRDGWYKASRGLAAYKPHPEEHLRHLELATVPEGVAETAVIPQRRVILVGNRNIANNFGVVAWHRDWCPCTFALPGEVLQNRTYTCLVWWRDRRLSVEELRLAADGAVAGASGEDLGEQIEWATYGSPVLRHGRVPRIEDTIHEFYDLRHVLAYDENVPADADDMWELWRRYPDGYREKMLAALGSGKPRSRYIHNCVGLAEDGVIILQRHGTLEEIGHWARQAGARDAVILDNGGSVFTWAWWPYRETLGEHRITGGYIHQAPDFRPASVSVLAFVLNGPVAYGERRGAVAHISE